MPLPLWAILGYGSYRAYRAGKLVKQAYKVAKVITRKPAALPKGKSAGTKDYVSAKERVSPWAKELTKAEQKGADKLIKGAGKAQKTEGKASSKRLKKVLKGKY